MARVPTDGLINWGKVYYDNGGAGYTHGSIDNYVKVDPNGTAPGNTLEYSFDIYDSAITTKDISTGKVLSQDGWFRINYSAPEGNSFARLWLTKTRTSTTEYKEAPPKEYAVKTYVIEITGVASNEGWAFSMGGDFTIKDGAGGWTIKRNDVDPNRGVTVDNKGNFKPAANQANQEYVYQYTLTWSGTTNPPYGIVVKTGVSGSVFAARIFTGGQVVEKDTCFTSGTLIETPQGARKVEDLKPGDLVNTLFSGVQEIIWTSSFTRVIAGSDDKHRPVLIRAGALGKGMPARDLRVSRQHRMLVRAGIAGIAAGAEEVLIPAVKLDHLDGVGLDDERSLVTYHHFLLKTHDVVISEGTPSESLHLGKETIKNLRQEDISIIAPYYPAILDAPERLRTVLPVLERRKDVKAYFKANSARSAQFS